MADDGGSLNANHIRALAAAFTQIDRLLGDVEAACAAQPSQSPFARFTQDLTSAQRQVALEYAARVRARMTEVMAGLGVRELAHRTRASWSITTALSFMSIALADVDPSRLRGYGPLDTAAAAFVRRVTGELDRSIGRLHAYLRQGLGRDLTGRLERLERVSVSMPLLKELERVIAERGLVELRAPLQALVEQLESREYEIALFGRVSSGKSSLLNAVLETDALPVGVTPITAVPTRVRWGETAIAEVHFAEGGTSAVPLAAVAELVSERQNPENRKHVTRVDVRLPSPRLRDGIVFVDTPGVGALASEGARSSYAYLPRCDLGIVLVDAAGTPTREDIELLRLLYDSGIVGRIVISKADLLDDASRAEMAAYVERQVEEALGLKGAVAFVSTRGAEVALAQRWFADEIAPMFAQSRSLAEASSRRKLGHLRQSVVAALEALGAGRRDDPDVVARRAKVEELASSAELALRQAERKLDHLSDRARTLPGEAIGIAARLIVDKEEGADPSQLIAKALTGAADRVATAACDELVALRDRLRDAVTAIGGRPDEVQVDLLGRPTVELPTELVGFVPRPRRWLRAMPGLRAQRIEAELRARSYDAIDTVFMRLASGLRTWTRASLQRLGEQFAAQAEPVRAQLRRLLGQERSDAADAIAADLAAIERLTGDGPRTVPASGPLARG